MAKCNVFSKRRTDKRMERKHYSQMSKLELDYLKEQVNKVRPEEVKLISHSKDKMNELQLNMKQVRNLLGKVKAYNIIEYNTGRGNETRVVLKDYTPIKCDNGEYVNILYSIDFTQKVIVSMWVNLVGDDHKTLDMSYYNKNLKIM